MKNVLYFFPLNPAEKNSGSISRAVSLLRYFKNRGCYIDFLSKAHWGQYTEASIEAFNKSGLADKLWVLHRKPPKKNAIKYFFTYKLWHILFERKMGLVKGSFPNHTTLYLRQQFDEILRQKQYDYIIISYAYWAHLVHHNPLVGNAVTVIDTHDFLSAQHQLDKHFDKGAAIGDELNRLSFFQQVWAISSQEAYFFRQFLGHKVKFIPMMMDVPQKVADTHPVQDVDLIYVATDNPHNLKASAWFFGEVYPLLPTDYRITVIGTITGHIPQGLPNVTCISFAENLQPFYQRSKVVLCPMLSGTGVKIKVVEAMANGIPVVCNESGIDGMPDRHHIGCFVTDEASEFATNIINLLGNDALRRQAGLQAHQCFLNNFEQQAVYRRLDNALNLPNDEKSK